MKVEKERQTESLSTASPARYRSNTRVPTERHLSTQSKTSHSIQRVSTRHDSSTEAPPSTITRGQKITTAAPGALETTVMKRRVPNSNRPDQQLLSMTMISPSLAQHNEVNKSPQLSTAIKGPSSPNATAELVPINLTPAPVSPNPTASKYAHFYQISVYFVSDVPFIYTNTVMH